MEIFFIFFFVVVPTAAVPTLGYTMWLSLYHPEILQEWISAIDDRTASYKRTLWKWGLYASCWTSAIVFFFGIRSVLFWMANDFELFRAKQFGFFLIGSSNGFILVRDSFSGIAALLLAGGLLKLMEKHSELAIRTRNSENILELVDKFLRVDAGSKENLLKAVEEYPTEGLSMNESIRKKRVLELFLLIKNQIAD